MDKYMSFFDKEGRNIEIYVDDYKIVAVHDDEQVAEFLYREIEIGCEYSPDSYIELYSMNVDENYQKAGIGSEILKVGEDIFDKVVYPKVGTENYPTIEGAALLNSAIRNGIIGSRSNVTVEDDQYDDIFGRREPTEVLSFDEFMKQNGKL